MSKVSVIMGIYNCAHTLPDAIDSLLHQTYSDWELIMCDDGSSDDTYQVAAEYQERYPEKIILIRNEKNMRLAKTLNHCLKHVSGDFIARMDGDDKSVSTRFEEQVSFLKQHPEYDLVGSQMISFDETGGRGIRQVATEPKKEDLAYGVPFCHATIMARRRVYEVLKGYSEEDHITRCEDVEFWFRFFEAGFRGYNLPLPLYEVRETLNDFKRRKLRYTFDTMRVCAEGFRRLHYPLPMYIFVLKPLASDLMPRRLIKKYHNYRDSKMMNAKGKT